MKKKNIHAIILARGGSKGIKNKNLIKVNSKPLVYWSINSFIKNKKIKKTWVSSDDRKILKISKKYGANIIVRPKKLANDKASSDLSDCTQSRAFKKNKCYLLAFNPHTREN